MEVEYYLIGFLPSADGWGSDLLLLLCPSIYDGGVLTCQWAYFRHYPSNHRMFWAA